MRAGERQKQSYPEDSGRGLLSPSGGLTVVLDEGVQVVRIEHDPASDADTGDSPLGPEPPYVSLAEAGVGTGHRDGQQGTPEELVTCAAHAQRLTPAGGESSGAVEAWGPR